jgi:hypothetical protein
VSDAWEFLAADRDKWKARAEQQENLATNWLKRINELEETMKDARVMVGILRRMFGCKHEIFDAYGEVALSHGDINSDLECLRQLIIAKATRPSSETTEKKH